MGENTQLLPAIVNQIGAVLIALITALSALIPLFWRAYFRNRRERRKARKERNSFQNEMEYALRFRKELMILREKVGSSRAVIWRRENGSYFGGEVPASFFIHFLEDVAPDAPGLRQETPPRWPAAQFADVWMHVSNPKSGGVYCARKLNSETLASGSARFAMKMLHGIYKVAFALVQNEFGNPIGILTTSWRRHEKMPSNEIVRTEMAKAAKAIAFHFASYHLEKSNQSGNFRNFSGQAK